MVTVINFHKFSVVYFLWQQDEHKFTMFDFYFESISFPRLERKPSAES